MDSTERMRWEQVAASWNANAERHSFAVDIQTELLDRFRAEGCCYRFSPSRMSARQDKWLQGKPRRPLSRVLLSTGEQVFETPLATPLRPTFLPPSLVRKLHAVGPQLEHLLRLSNGFLASHTESLALFGDPIKGEFDWIEANAGLEPITQWLRIDYTWRWQSEGAALTVLDINLLPGMTFVNERIAAICHDVFITYGLCRADELNDRFDAAHLLRELDAAFQRDESAASPRSVAVLSRSLHGLGCDASLCAERVAEALRCPATVTSPTALDGLLRPHDSRRWTEPPPTAIVRMARPVSKHAGGPLGEEEDAAMAALVRRLKSGPITYPAFNAYLENHAWFYIWQTNAFFAFAHHHGAADLLREIRSLLPRTGVVTADANLLDDTGSRLLTTRDFRGSVLKRGNSTGGHDLAVLFGASSGQTLAALERVRADLSAGWVLQEFVEPRREIFPVFHDDRVNLVRGFMVNAAYYSAGRYLGGHALMSPSSRKVHGGFDSYLTPVFTI